MQHNNVCIILEFLNLSDLDRGCQGDLAFDTMASLRGMGYPYEMVDLWLSYADNYAVATNLEYRWNSMMTREEADKKGVPCRGYSSLKALYVENGGHPILLTGEAEDTNEYLEFTRDNYTPQVRKDPKPVAEEEYDFEFSPIDIPTQVLSPLQQTEAFLRILFDTGEGVNFSKDCMSSSVIEADIAIDNAQDIHDAGMHFLNCNPCTDNGNSNVTDYHYTLVESDVMSLEEQYGYLVSSKLPIATVTYSGGKSLHALVKIMAKDKDEYNARVLKLHKFLTSTGFDVDSACKDPSRYTRIAGVSRGDTTQTLVAFNLGTTYEEWQAEFSQETSAEASEFKASTPKVKVSYTVQPIPVSKAKGQDKKIRKAIDSVKGTSAYRILMES